MRPLLLGLMLVVACSSGAERDDRGSSASLGEAESGPASNATAWTSGEDSTSSSGTATASSISASSTTSPEATTDDSDSLTSTGGDTTGSVALSCADDESACNAWFLSPGAMQWEALTIGGPAALAPAGPVRAAFDIEASMIGFLVTDDELVRVDLSTRAWLSKTAIDDQFSEVNVQVESAYSIPAHWANMPGAPESIALAGTDVAFLYEYDEAADSFAFDQAVPLGDSWNGPAAPQAGTVREMWLDVTNADGWLDANASRVCPGADGPIGPYMAVLTDRVFVLDAGYCFEFFPPIDFDMFPPLARPGVPAVDRIGGIVYNETRGLVVFAVD